MALLPAIYCWQCLAYVDWFWFSLLWDNSAPFHSAINDVVMQLACLTAGMEYKGERMTGWVNTYGMIEVTTSLPFPFDHYWDSMNTTWYEMGAQYDVFGDANWDECAVFKFPGNQGGAWPPRWPP